MLHPSERQVAVSATNLLINNRWIANEYGKSLADFFESVPTGADAYLLRWILHDWSEPEAAAILASLRQAMKPTARLILVEHVIAEAVAFDLGKWIDLQMLITVGGCERSEMEYRTLLSGAAFDLQKVVATASPLSLLVANQCSERTNAGLSASVALRGIPLEEQLVN